MHLNDLQPQFHRPTGEEVDVVCEVGETVLYLELTLLNGNCSKISPEERTRALRLIYWISIGCLRMSPRVHSEKVEETDRWFLWNGHTMFAMHWTSRKPGSRVNHDFQLNVSFVKSRENLLIRLIVEMGTSLGW